MYIKCSRHCDCLGLAADKKSVNCAAVYHWIIDYRENMYSMMEKNMERGRKGPRLYTNRLFLITIVVLVVGLSLTALNVYELRQMQNTHMAAYHGYLPNAEAQSARLATTRPVMWLHAKRIESGYLNHVIAVFDRLGFLRGGPESAWDMLWTHDYPFTELSSHIMNMKPHQRLNHYPGIGFITNKVYLATSKLKYIPLAFEMPRQKEDFLKTAHENPEMLWVQKSNNHRGIKVKGLEELDFDATNTFVQEYVQNPFLIDSRKFDIGIYTVIASIDPLRLYVYEEETLIRFCSKDYYPVDFTDVNKYVVGDDYTPTWKMPSLKEIYEDMSHTHKRTLNIYLELKGKNPQHIWDQMYDSIQQTVTYFEPRILNAAQKFKSIRNFVELVRFDFVLDENLNVYLMEVNMSPNLSSKHFGPNKLMYEQVIFNYLNLVGVARPIPTSYQHSTADEKNMLVSERDISVFGARCASDVCRTCVPQECKLCSRCLSPDEKDFLKQGFLEHNNRRNMKRLFPVPLETQDNAVNLDIGKYTNLTDNNRLMHLWYQGKCLYDSRWCT